MEFFNPNIASEMAQILKSFQEKYVPIYSKDNVKDILSRVALHGDQLFEERARTVQWTFQLGNEIEKLTSLLPEHADWHVKVTLYKVSE